MSNYITLGEKFSYFNVKFIQELFEQYSELEKGSYAIFEARFADGSFSMCFQFPTDFDLMQAEELVSKITGKITMQEMFNCMQDNNNNNKVNQCFPQTLVEYDKKFLFGLVSISVCVEDRKAKDHARNYKHVITFKVLWKRFYIIIRSPSFGYYKMDGVDINYMS